MNNRFKIAHDFVETIMCDEIKKIILYGSVARGDDSEDSDIDLLIITSTRNPKLESKIIDRAADFLLQTGELISPFVMSEEHFNKTKDLIFLKTVINEGTII